MLEFTSVSVSSFEAPNLSDELQRLSSEGWTVVSIVNAGSDIVAYLSRQASGTPQEPAAAPAVEQPAQEGGVGWGMQSTASETTASAEPSSVASSAAAPAGWYADPSGRFELRYWNGDSWTEHVSRAGQQSTDPPVV